MLVCKNEQTVKDDSVANDADDLLSNTLKYIFGQCASKEKNVICYSLLSFRE